MYTYLKPSEIRFSQDSIAGRFRKGGFLNTAILDIKNGSLRPETFPAISVIHYNGGLYSLDNRRLYVFRVCEYNGWITKIPVIMASSWGFNSERFTTNNQGVTIDVRQGGTMKHYKESWLSIPDNTRRKNTPLTDDKIHYQTSPIVSPITVHLPTPTTTQNISAPALPTRQTRTIVSPNTFHLPVPNTKQTSPVPALPIRQTSPIEPPNTFHLSDPTAKQTVSGISTRTRITPEQAEIFDSNDLPDDKELLLKGTFTSAPQHHRSLSDHSREYFSNVTIDTPASAPLLEESRVVHRQKTGLLRRIFDFCCCCCIDFE